MTNREIKLIDKTEQRIEKIKSNIRSLSHAREHFELYVIDMKSGNRTSARMNKKLGDNLLRKVRG